MPKKGYTRRQVLKGAAGASLAIPFLPSITRAQLSSKAPKRLVCLWWPHGGVHPDMNDGAFFPRSETLNWQTRTMVGSETYKVADLKTNLSINEKMSDILDGGFNPYMSKVNLYHGLDILQNLDHHNLPFGSIGPKYPRFGASDPFNAREAPRTGTVDQEIARYPGFYPASFNGPKSVHISPFDQKFGVQSSGYVGANNEIIQNRFYGDTDRIFEQLFGEAISADDSQGLKSIVDAVLDDYRRMRKLSDLSSVDKGRLDNHIQGLADINRRFEQRAKECSEAVKPPSLENYAPRNRISDGVERASFINDMIASAFLCDTTRIASLSVGYGNAIPDWPLNDEHGTLWHPWTKTDQQGAIRRSVWYFIRAIVLDLVEKLDRMQDVDGSSVLDNTLIVIMGENASPHTNLGQPILTIGSAGGAIKTGKVFDYRHATIASGRRADYANFVGLPMNCFFNTVLQAFDVPPSYYEKPRSGVYQYGGFSAVATTESHRIADFFKVDPPKIYDLKTDPLGRVYQRRNRSGVMEFWKESGRIRLTDQPLPGVMA